MNLTADQRKVRRRLIECARQERTVTYGEVAGWVDMSPESVGRMVLDPINEAEISAGRPMLSALVVNRSHGRPGSGFFRMARQRGRQGHDLGDELFWHREIALVFDAHKRREPRESIK